ncbi:MAG: L,D-transpeptidase [Pseudomonadota bacterium]
MAPAPTSAELTAAALRAKEAERRRNPVTVRPDWREHFNERDIAKGAILINIDKRWLVYWEPGAVKSHAFPIAVPMTEELTRTGRTKITWRRKDPDWTATPSMIEANPEVPRYIPPGPHNPLGEYALYLSWRYYAIHGTNTPGVIGDRVTAGCFRLFSEDIKWLFDNVPNGTPVMVVQDIGVAPADRDSIGVSGSPSGELPPSAENPPLVPDLNSPAAPLEPPSGPPPGPSASAPDAGSVVTATAIDL